jgi:uncharacterized protein (DUF433 family)
MEDRRFTLYGGQDPRLMPAYSISEVARAIKTPPSTVRWWARGRGGYAPVIELPDPGSVLLSFVNLVEAHVLSAMCRRHKLHLSKVREALIYIRENIGIPHPLASAKFETDGVDLFVHWSEQFINLTRGGQLAMRNLLVEHLNRVEYDGGTAVRLFPFIAAAELGSERAVMIDPLVQFGRPVLTRTRIPTEIVAERYNAGEDLDALAQDYGQERALLEAAVLFESAAA